MSFNRVWRLALLTAFAFAGGARVARAGDDPMVEYAKFQAAAKSNDEAATLLHIRRAYTQAEKVWGARERRTAIFATSYADHIVKKTDFPKARDLFARCSEILLGLGEGVTTERAYCQLREADVAAQMKEIEAAITALEQAIETLEKLSAVGDRYTKALLASAYVAFANLLSFVEEEKEANSVPASEREKDNLLNSARYAAKAEALLQEISGSKSAEVASIFVLQGSIAERLEEWESAAEFYEAALPAYHEKFGLHLPASKSIELRAKRARAIFEITASGGDLTNASKSGRMPSSPECLFNVRADREELEICPVNRPAPIYPQAALSMWEEGFVVVEYDIAAGGMTENVRVVDSWPAFMFNSSATDAVKSWTFNPPSTKSGTIQRANQLKSLVRFEIAD